MRQLVLAIAAVAALAVASTSTTEAAGYYGYGASAGRSTGGFFSGLMNLERRKNAWLLRMIGR